MILNRPIKDTILKKQLNKHFLSWIDSDLWKISVMYIKDNFTTKSKKPIKKLALNSLTLFTKGLLGLCSHVEEGLRAQIASPQNL